MESGKRKYERCDVSQIIAYSIPSDNGHGSLTGLLCDYSYSGLCLISNQPLQDGQEILVKSSLMTDSTTATVCWCKDIGNNTYKIGLKFTR
jgi:hypothetical protein